MNTDTSQTEWSDVSLVSSCSDIESETSQIVNKWVDTLSDTESEISIHGDTNSEESDLEGFFSETEDDPLWANDEDPDWSP